MRKLTTLSSILLLLSLTSQAQNADNSNSKVFPPIPGATRTATERDGVLSTKGMSPSTAFLILDMKTREKNPEAITEQELIKKYCLIRKGGKLYANSFLIGNGNFSIGMLDGFGVLPGSKSGNVYTGMVPIDQLTRVLASGLVKYVDIGKQLYPHMDSARNATNVNKVHKGLAPLNMPYTGKGVVVGDIDAGFDFTHPNFFDTSGTNNYRIKRIWKQNSTWGTPPAGYSYGEELVTESTMQFAKSDSNGNHGCHTAGIAAGAGGYPNSPYKGVAYESDIVMVATDLSSTKVADGIKYIQAYAASVNKPCVINMSFGGQNGPHDGTSADDQFNDSATGPGKILVSAAGNDGQNSLYLEHDFFMADTTAQTFCSFSQLSVGAGGAFIWGTPNENFSVRIGLFNTSTLQMEDMTPYKIPAAVSSVFVDTMKGTNNRPVYITFYCGIDPNNNKPNITIEIDNKYQTDYSRKIIIEITGHNTNVKMWGVQKNITDFTNNGFKPPVYSGRTDHTVSDGGGCGNGVITVGAYTSKNTWSALNNTTQGAPSMAPVGEIAPFSSMGPTADGRTKPDITAPGNILASSVNSFSSSYGPLSARTVKAVTYGSRTWYFGMMEGTSMSCPMVTGIVALWLQKYPKLTKEQALNLMKTTAITDAYTGSIPATGSNTWGWGKINAFQGMITVLGIDDVKNTLNTKVYPNPVTNEVNIAFDKAFENGTMVIYDMTGRVVSQKQLAHVSAGQIETVNTNGLSAGTYVLKLSCDKATGSYKIIKQ